MSEINVNEIFAGLYDEIFLQDIKNIYTGDSINSITKKYLGSNATVEEKKFFLQLKNQYFRIKSINDYEILQKKLYSNKSRCEIILFEIARILKNDKLNVKISEQISDVKKLLTINGDDELTDELYEKIINFIIRIEMSLGMKIGLFNELCNMFENEMDRIDQELVVDTLTYNKRK